MSARYSWFMAICVALSALAFQTNAQPGEKDVPIAPVSPAVANKMLEMAKVTADDVVYDLGCGDGRIVIPAARKYGAHGKEVDTDPQRIARSQANAQAAGVADRVEFQRGNLSDVDLSQVTVLALHQQPAINDKLRPRILAECKPGTRVVSHHFDMGPWEPDAHDVVDGEKIYLWVVPARVAGTWLAMLPDGKGVRPATVQLQQHYQRVSGTMNVDGKVTPIRDATLTGNRLIFVVNTDGQELKYTMRVPAPRPQPTVQDGDHSAQKAGATMPPSR